METLLVIVLPIYIVFAGFMFVWIKPVIMKVISDSDVEELGKYAREIIVTLCTFMWPIVIFGIGAGWGCKMYYDRATAKIGIMMNQLVEKTTKDGVITGKEEWHDFFAQNIKRIPRRKLVLLSIVGWDECELGSTEIKKIVSSELADRDLFDIKF